MKQIAVDGPEVERADGTARCIGYGIDDEGRVTGRFALPSGTKWQAPVETETVETSRLQPLKGPSGTVIFPSVVY